MIPGQMLSGRYRLTRRIAAGGMGEVWRADDTRLERVVAIKMLHSGLAEDSDFRHRFLQEARTLASLSQPGIVNLYDTCDETDDHGRNVSYLVMEYVAGHPLSAVVSEHGVLDPRETMRLVHQVARGLDAAHRAGIIHRDIKPANILIDRAGDATVVDFGIARRHGDVALTATGSVMGTVDYASPEQLHGEELTGASDIYSLGVVAYECLTGRPPFPGNSVAGIITAHLTRQPPPLAARIPEPIAAVVMRALAKDPHRRFDSAAQFARACRDAAFAQPSPPRQPSTVPLPQEPQVPSPPRPAARQPATPAPSGRFDRDDDHDEEQPVDRRAPAGRRTTLIAVLVALVVLLGAGAVYFAFQPDTGGDSGNDSADGGQQHDQSAGDSDSQSPQPTSSPQEPDRPTEEPTPLRNVATELCLDVGSSDKGGTVVHTLECDEELSQDFSIVAAHNDDGEGFRLEDEVGNCPLWYEFNAVLDFPCEQQSGAHWRFTWVGNKDGQDTWIVHVASDETDFCLTDSGKDVEAVECVDGDTSQQWRTTAA
jgi:serine/threonine protein kinase